MPLCKRCVGLRNKCLLRDEDCFTKEVPLSKSGPCLRKECLFPKAVPVYETSTPFQNRPHFTKLVLVYKSGPCLRKKCLLRDEGCFTKEVPLSKSGPCLRKECLFPKAVPVYETSTPFQNRPHFTKEVPLSKSGPCLRKECLFPKVAPVYKTNAPFQNRSQKNSIHLHRNRQSCPEVFVRNYNWIHRNTFHPVIHVQGFL